MKNDHYNDKMRRDMVKNWLNEYRFFENHTSTLTNRLAYTLSVIKSALDNMEEVSKEDSTHEKSTKSYKSAIKLENMLNESLSELSKKCDEVIKAVEALPSPEVRKVISDRYYKNMTLKAIAYEMDVSLSKVKYLHRVGLDWLALGRVVDSIE